MNQLANVFTKVFNDLPRVRNGTRIQPEPMKAFCYLLDRHTAKFEIENPSGDLIEESINITFKDGSSLNITAPLQRRLAAKISILSNTSLSKKEANEANNRFYRWFDIYIEAMNKLANPCHTDADEMNALAYRLALALDFKYGIAKMAGHPFDPLLAC